MTINSREKSSIISLSKETTQDELKRLRAENKLLKQERDILKKATAYFAKLANAVSLEKKLYKVCLDI
jgi:transposase-like protein